MVIELFKSSIFDQNRTSFYDTRNPLSLNVLTECSIYSYLALFSYLCPILTYRTRPWTRNLVPMGYTGLYTPPESRFNFFFMN